MKQKLLLTTSFLLLFMGMNAQMTFTYSVNAETTTEAGGLTHVTVPSGTDWSSLITGVKVDGVTVSASEVSPNPTTTKIYPDRLEVFTYNDKAYAFRFESDEYFTAVFISDCHVNQGEGHDGTSDADLTTIMNNICAMGKNGSQKVVFSAKPNYVPRTSIIFCLGDIDQDKGDDGSSGSHTKFLGATAEVAKTAGIPFIFIAGNHDLSPDYWTGSNPDKGATYSGSSADDKTISAITTNNNYWNGQGVFDENIQYFIDNSKSSYFQSKPFTFKFNDVRFYCAQTYWFQKLYQKPGWFGSATYYAPDAVINALSAFVDAHADEASVWMQHYPWLAGSDCDRWWLDQNDVGLYIPTTDDSDYGCHDANISPNDTEKANTLKKNPLSAIMMKAAGKLGGKVQHFSGHYHRFDERTYSSSVNSSNLVQDYTVAAPGNPNQSENAFVVLMKRGVGVVEVKKAQF